MTDSAGPEQTRSEGGNENVSSDKGRNRFGYSGPNRRNNRGRKPNYNNFRMQSTLFKGREPSLKGHIYDFTREQNPDQFIKTIKQIKLYDGRTYKKYPAEFTKAIADLHLEDPVAPVRPVSAGDQFDMENWRLDAKEYHVKAAK